MNEENKKSDSAIENNQNSSTKDIITAPPLILRDIFSHNEEKDDSEKN